MKLLAYGSQCYVNVAVIAGRSSGLLKNKRRNRANHSICLVVYNVHAAKNDPMMITYFSHPILFSSSIYLRGGNNPKCCVCDC